MAGRSSGGNGLAEPCLKTTHWGLYIVRMLVEVRWEVPIRIMNRATEIRWWQYEQPRPGVDQRHHPGLPQNSHMEGAIQWFRISNSRDLTVWWTAAKGGVWHQTKSQCQRSMRFGEVNIQIPGHFSNEEGWIWEDPQSLPLYQHQRRSSDPSAPCWLPFAKQAEVGHQRQCAF
jgi:hypothetical protein